MLVFVAVGSNEVRAIGRAIDGDFAPGAAADGTNLFAFGGAEAGRFAFFTDGAEHEFSSAD